MRTWDFTHAEAARDRSVRGREARAARRQRKQQRGTVDESSAVQVAESAASLAAARRALLDSLLAEGAQESGEEGPSGGQQHQGSHAMNGSDSAIDDAAHADSAYPGADSDPDSASGRGIATADQVGDLPPDLIDEHAQPLRRQHRTASGRGGSGKGYSPHSGTAAAANRHSNQHWAASPPPPAVQRRGSGDAGAGTGRAAMATWRIVRPNRQPSGSLNK